MRIASIIATVLVAAAVDVGAFSPGGAAGRIVSPLATQQVARGGNKANTLASNAERRAHASITHQVVRGGYKANTLARSNAERAHASITTSLRATDEDAGNDGGIFAGIEINPLYAAPYAFFLLFGFYMTSHEAAGASQIVLEKFIADPLHPGVNELFATVFNLIGLVGIPLACIIMPSAKGQRFSAPPFLIASAAVGYGAVGPYMMTRKPVTSVDVDELGWVTKNVLENKIFNWFMVIVAMSSLFTTGLLSALFEDFGATVSGYADIFSSTAIAGVSSVDFAILCATAASLIPEDLERRGFTDKSKANAIAASTLLLPMIGATIYCALRPPLPENE